MFDKHRPLWPFVLITLCALALPTFGAHLAQHSGPMLTAVGDRLAFDAPTDAVIPQLSTYAPLLLINPLVPWVALAVVLIGGPTWMALRDWRRRRLLARLERDAGR